MEFVYQQDTELQQRDRTGMIHNQGMKRVKHSSEVLLCHALAGDSAVPGAGSALQRLRPAGYPNIQPLLLKQF